MKGKLIFFFFFFKLIFKSRFLGNFPYVKSRERDSVWYGGVNESSWPETPNLGLARVFFMSSFFWFEPSKSSAKQLRLNPNFRLESYWAELTQAKVSWLDFFPIVIATYLVAKNICQIDSYKWQQKCCMLMQHISCQKGWIFFNLNGSACVARFELWLGAFESQAKSVRAFFGPRHRRPIVISIWCALKLIKNKIKINN